MNQTMIGDIRQSIGYDAIEDLYFYRWDKEIGGVNYCIQATFTAKGKQHLPEKIKEVQDAFKEKENNEAIKKAT